MSTRPVIPRDAGRLLSIRAASAFTIGLLTAALVLWLDFTAFSTTAPSTTFRVVLAALLFLLGTAAGFISLMLLDVLLWLAARVSRVSLSLPSASHTVSRSLWPLAAAVLFAAASVVLLDRRSPLAQVLPGLVIAAAFAVHVALIMRQPGPLRAATPRRRLGVASVYAGIPLMIVIAIELAR